MNLHDLYSNVKVEYSLTGTTLTGTTNGTAVDLRGYGSAMVVATVGTPSTAYTSSATLTVSVQQSTDNSTWTAVAAADLQGAIAASATSGSAVAHHKVGYIGTARYLRIVVTRAGAVNAAVFGAVLLGDPEQRPVD